MTPLLTGIGLGLATGGAGAVATRLRSNVPSGVPGIDGGSAITGASLGPLNTRDGTVGGWRRIVTTRIGRSVTGPWLSCPNSRGADRGRWKTGTGAGR